MSLQRYDRISKKVKYITLSVSYLSDLFGFVNKYLRIISLFCGF